MNVKDAGLGREYNDWKAQRIYGENVDLVYRNEFMQPMPMFFTREGNTIPLIGNWRGSVAFVIASGPSFAKLDHSKLDNCFTMGTNNSVKTYRPDSWVSVDDPTRFLYSIWRDPKIMKFVPYGAAEKPIWNNYVDEPATVNGKEIKVGDCPNILFFKRNSKFHESRWLTECTFNWGNQDRFGGGRSVLMVAIRLLYLLGFRTIYLLGVDFNMSKDNGYHFEQDRSKSAINCNMKTYKRMQEEYFPKLKPKFEEAGLNVFNCNPDSALTVFDHVPFDDAVAHANSIIGDVINEPTEGMYIDPKKKMKQYKDRQKRKGNSLNCKKNDIEADKGLACKTQKVE